MFNIIKLNEKDNGYGDDEFNPWIIVATI